jgi:hypothetical protein
MKYLASFGIAMICALTLVYHDAGADQYRLTTGKKEPVCELCKKNLDSFHNTSITCGRQYNPKFTDLKPVEWTKLDVMANKELVMKVDQYAASGDQNATGKTFRGGTKAEFERSLSDDVRREMLSLSMTRTDVNADGVPDVLLRYESGTCPLTKNSAHLVYVLTPDGTALDPEKMNKMLGGVVVGTSVGLFQYRGKMYVDIWDDLAQELFVQGPLDAYERKLCAFKRERSGKGSKIQGEETVSGTVF